MLVNKSNLNALVGRRRLQTPRKFLIFKVKPPGRAFKSQKEKHFGQFLVNQLIISCLTQKHGVRKVLVEGL